MLKESPYFDSEWVCQEVDAGRHREVVGGVWDEIGRLQLEFLKREGLEPRQRPVDVGCGSLRGGIHFVRYLDPGNYFGVDINESLLDAGYEIELKSAGLVDRLPRNNLVCVGDFNFESVQCDFDFALAQSLFTHLTFNRIRECLERLAPKLKRGGRFYATFFELPEDIPAHLPLRHSPSEVATHGTEDPYHYRFADVQHAAVGLPWDVRYIGDWQHPRAQRMIMLCRI